MFRCGSGVELDLCGGCGFGEGGLEEPTGDWTSEALTCREACGVLCPLFDATGTSVPVSSLVCEFDEGSVCGWVWILGDKVVYTRGNAF